MQNPSLDYVKIRAKEPSLSSREAARRAGFACGVPSQKARRLWEMFETVGKDPEFCAAIYEERRRVLERLAVLDEWMQVAEV